MKKCLFLVLGLALVAGACKNSGNSKSPAGDPVMTAVSKGTFGYDLNFLSKHHQTLLLKATDNPNAQVVVVPGFQARVMTSTADGASGNSYGWLNYPLISGEKGYQPHINAYGGEDRFWIAPEGGQFSVFFPKGADFTFENWQTPGLIDTAAFEQMASTSSEAYFHKKATLKNYLGTEFNIEIQRKISVMRIKDIPWRLDISDLNGLEGVGFETENTITNLGPNWQKDRGVLGIWILGMFNPSDKTTVVAPYATTVSKSLLLTDDYFGKVPADRLKVTDAAVFFKGDGKLRSKIGLAPGSARPFAAAYDAERGVLTIIQYDLNQLGNYLKSTWEQHANPYSGDAFNSYNDGPVADGTQLGPFYELESTSPAVALKTGEKLIHHHRTIHLEGDRASLDRVAKAVLGVGIDEIEKAVD